MLSDYQRLSDGKSCFGLDSAVYSKKLWSALENHFFRAMESTLFPEIQNANFWSDFLVFRVNLDFESDVSDFLLEKDMNKNFNCPIFFLAKKLTKPKFWNFSILLK